MKTASTLMLERIIDQWEKSGKYDVPTVNMKMQLEDALKISAGREDGYSGTCCEDIETENNTCCLSEL